MAAVLQVFATAEGSAPRLEEFTLGILFPFFVDYRYLAHVVIADIDLRKQYEPDLVARFGPPIIPFANTSSYRPTMRIRPVHADSGSRESVGLQSGINFVFGLQDRYPPVDGIVGEFSSLVIFPVASLGAAYKVNHIGTAAAATDLSDKDRFPYFFRTSTPASAGGRVIWNYLVYFRFKAAPVMYIQEDGAQSHFTMIASLAQQAGRQKAITGVPVTYTLLEGQEQQDEWDAAVLRMKAVKVRLLVIIVPSVMRTIVKYIMQTGGLCYPTYQTVHTNNFLNQQTWYQEAHTSHVLYPWVKQDAAFVRYWTNYMRLNVTDFTDSVNVRRYAFDTFYDSPATRFSPEKIKQSMFSAIPLDNGGVFIVGMMLYDCVITFARAFGELLNRGVPRAEIRGDVLRAQLEQTRFEAVGTDISFDKFHDLAYADWYVMAARIAPDARGVLAPSYTPLFLQRTLAQANGSFTITTNGVMPNLWATGDISLSAPRSLLSCVPGQYLLRSSPDDLGLCTDCLLGEYTNVTDATECVRCPAGTKGNADLKGCTACDPGTFNPDKGAKTCINCQPGSAAEAAGSDSCPTCPAGWYASAQKQTACASCQPQGLPASGVNLTTLLPGSTSQTACHCPDGAYEPAGAPGTCLACPAGMDCAFGTSLVMEQGRRLEAGKLPQAKPGYMTLPEDVLGAYLCNPASYCPGGPPGSCEAQRVGPACGECPAGTADAGKKDCLPCSPGANVLAGFFWVGMVVLAIIMYYFGNGPITSKSTPLIGMSASLSILLMTFQVVGIFKRLSIPFPEGTTTGVINVSAILLFDWRTLIPLPCMVSSALKAYLIGVVGFPLTCVAIVLCWGASRALVTCRVLPNRFPYSWEWDKAQNAIGTFLQATFIVMASTAATPMICYKHPNGKSSVAKMPAILCGEGDHPALLALGCLLMIFAAAYYTGILYLLLTAASKQQSVGVVAFYRRMRFLVLLFRLDRYYWAAIVSLRSLSLSLVPVIVPDSAHDQQLLLSSILQVYAVGVCVLWPWKVPILNLLDATACVSLVIVLMISGGYIPSSPELAAGQQAAMSALIIALYSTSGTVLVGCMAAVLVRGKLGGVFEPFLLRWAFDVNGISESLVEVAKDLSWHYQGGVLELQNRMEHWQYEDIKLIEKTIEVLRANGETEVVAKGPIQNTRLNWAIDEEGLRTLTSTTLKSQSVSQEGMSVKGSLQGGVTSGRLSAVGEFPRRSAGEGFVIGIVRV